MVLWWASSRNTNRQLWSNVDLRVDNVFLQHILWYLQWIALILCTFGRLNIGGMMTTMRIDDEFGQLLILHWIVFIFDHTQYIETWQNWFGEIDVLGEGHAWIVTSSDWIGGSDNRTTCLQRCDQTGFGNGNRLLFHGFVDGCTILVVHLVELVCLWHGIWRKVIY